YVIILKNVTELKEQDLAKTNFMATLSHELKTPISAIDMSLGLLRDERIGQLNEDQKDLATTIQQNSERLLKMVNEILDISRIETGQLQIQEEPADPAEIVLKAVEGTKTFFAEKGVRIQQHIADDLPSLLVDVPKTTGVLINFLTNAVRYSPENDFVRIAVVRRNGSIEFSVSDNGPGISREEQARIFKRFRRAKDDKTKGTGLGLSISKEFIEQQGGRIWVKSQVGKGSTFGFSLPVKK
ncbi:MAG: PAS domain-containing sensor histidine kinase, partial [Saprospiraceae bacterium]|nr:PAS domain-containing sensor histidine kinase [Saprospiraceae bacterium]